MVCALTSCFPAHFFTVGATSSAVMGVAFRHDMYFAKPSSNSPGACWAETSFMAPGRRSRMSCVTRSAAGALALRIIVSQAGWFCPVDGSVVRVVLVPSW